MLNRAAYLGATRSIINTTADGAGETVSCMPASAIAMQIVAGTGSTGQGTGTITLQGSLNGNDWTTVTTSTYDGSRTVSYPAASSQFLIPFTNLRASAGSHSSTNDLNVWIAAR